MDDYLASRREVLRGLTAAGASIIDTAPAYRQSEQTIGDLLPSAVGVALSPVPITAVILILGTPQARTNGPAFGLGWVVGLVVLSVIVVIVASGSDTSSDPSTTIDVFELVLGLLFLLMAFGQCRKRPKAPSSSARASPG